MAHEQDDERGPAPVLAEGAAIGSHDLLRSASESGDPGGLFVAGAAVSVTRGVQELITPEPASHFVVGYVVLAGLLIAAAGLAAHQLTGSPIPDAAGSILVGVLLAAVSILLINQNRRFLVGQGADPRVRAATIQALLDAPEVARVTYLRLEIVGPRMVSVIGDVDLTADDSESHLALRLRALEARITASPAVAGAVLRRQVSAPGPAATPDTIACHGLRPFHDRAARAAR